METSGDVWSGEENASGTYMVTMLSHPGLSHPGLTQNRRDCLDYIGLKARMQCKLQGNQFWFDIGENTVTPPAI